MTSSRHRAQILLEHLKPQWPDAITARWLDIEQNAPQNKDGKSRDFLLLSNRRRAVAHCSIGMLDHLTEAFQADLLENANRHRNRIGVVDMALFRRQIFEQITISTNRLSTVEEQPRE